MIPIMLDPAMATIALVGRGQLTVDRLAWLRAGGASPIVFSDRPDSALSAAAGGGLCRRLPAPDDLLGLNVLWIADLPDNEAIPLVRQARQARLLVNWEDRRDSCDFHNPALVRRGDLLFSISTGGKSPGLASRLRRWLEQAFGQEWEGRLDDLAARRLDWKRKPRDLDELAALTNDVIDGENWLPRENRASGQGQAAGQGVPHQ